MAIFTSSTRSIPESGAIPRHIAVIMDGNGRWAKKRLLPRVAGHKRGVEIVRDMVKQCATLGVEYLTLFAFSSENWRRPPEEVSFLMGLFMEALKKEVIKLHENNIRLIMIGDRSQFDAALCAKIDEAEAMTQDNTGLVLTIAANYGGRWDMLQAMNRMLQAKPELAGNFDEQDITPYLSMHYAPEPDLFIRTGGEQRISNFLLWQLAYSELYFTDTLWPDFNEAAFRQAIKSYQKRERRFGRTSEQLVETQDA
ncbi:MAG TPA: isoprenyl transferase [Methylophilaceae bacterium]|nr:isoprenyl transferase [Methylophilaceae bacterium]